MKDLRKAVDSINKLGNDFRIIHTGNKRVICSVAVELNADHLGVGQYYGLLACMLTGRSWNSIQKGIDKSEKNAAEV